MICGAVQGKDISDRKRANHLSLLPAVKKSSFNASDQPSDQRPVDFEEIQKKGKHEVSLAYLI